MNRQMILSLFIVGLLSVIQTVNGIKCYHCNAQDDEACNKGLPTLDVRNCPNRSDKCEAYGYEIVKDGKVAKTGYQRGCLSEMGPCSLIRGTMQGIYGSPLFRDQKFQETACSACESDLCNNK